MKTIERSKAHLYDKATRRTEAIPIDKPPAAPAGLPGKADMAALLKELHVNADLLDKASLLKASPAARLRETRVNAGLLDKADLAVMLIELRVNVIEIAVWMGAWGLIDRNSPAAAAAIHEHVVALMKNQGRIMGFSSSRDDQHLQQSGRRRSGCGSRSRDRAERDCCVWSEQTPPRIGRVHHLGRDGP